MKHTLLSALRAIGRPVAHYPNLSKVFDSNNVGVFLSQMLYWEGKQANPDGWIRKTVDDIEKELGFGRYEMESIRRKLKDHGVMEECKMGMPAKLHYRIDWDLINEKLHTFLDIKEQAQELKLQPQEPQEKKEPQVKKETVSYRMKAAYIEERTLIMPEAEEYNFTKKDWNFIKLFKELLIKRITRKQGENHIVSDDEVVISWKKFLAAIPQFYQEKQFFPSGLYTNFSAIEQSIIEQSKFKNDKPKTKTNGVDFRTAIRETP
jgi:hypothetical protein